MKMEKNKLTQYSTLDAYKTYVIMFVFMALFFLGFYIIVGACASANDVDMSVVLSAKHAIYFQSLVSPMMFCALFFWQNRKGKYRTINILGINKKPNIKYVFIAILMSIFCLVFFASFSNLFDAVVGLVGFNPSDSLNLVKDNVGYLFLNIFVMALLPAIFEELVFRGIIFQGLKTSHSLVISILLSALMFSLMHGSLQQTVFQFIIGVVLAIVMHYTDNILYPIIMHFTNNAVVVTMDFFTTAEEVNSQYVFNAWTIIVPIILAILGAVILFVIYKKIKKAKTSNQKVLVINKTFSTYSVQEKGYAVCGFLIAGIVWISNTIAMF